MIEVPSAALLADYFASQVDFFSIGTNDLTQYTLAMDRGNEDLSPLIDGLHPSVLKLIQLTCQGARAHSIPVGICGGLAGDLDAIKILLGLGVQELSVSPPLIPEIKALIRTLDTKQCKDLASKALLQYDSINVRNLFHE